MGGWAGGDERESGTWGEWQEMVETLLPKCRLTFWHLSSVSADVLVIVGE